MKKTTLDYIANKCDEVAYKVLSDKNNSKLTASMSEEGREAVAKLISEKLLVELSLTLKE